MLSKKILNKDFTLVVIGQIISLFGNGILRFALPLYLLEITGSSAIFGIVSALSFLPLIILMPIGGIIADRCNKRNIMVILDFSTALLMLVFYLTMNTISPVPLLIVTMMILYSISGLYQPAVSASVPVMLDSSILIKGNSIVSGVSSISNLLSPIIGGILFGSFGITPIVILSVICFIISAILEIFIKIPYQYLQSSLGVLKTVKYDIKENIQFIFKEKPQISKMIFIACALNLFISSLFIIAVPVLITERLGLSSQLYGISGAILALGGLFGGIATGILGNKIKISNLYKWVILLSVSLIPLAVSMSFKSNPMLSFILISLSSFLAMGIASLLSIRIMTYVQNQTDTTMTGKVISTLMMLSLCTQPLGQLIYGLLFEYLIGFESICILISILAAFAIGIYAKKQKSNIHFD